MYGRKSRRCGALMLAFSVCLRLFLLLGLDAKAAAFLSDAAKEKDFVRWLLFLETGQAVSADLPREPERLYVLEVEQPEEIPQQPAEELPEMPVPAKLPLTDAKNLKVSGGCTYSYDKLALFRRASAMDFSGPGPHILIVHTHSTEAYTPSEGFSYLPTDAAYRTLEAEHSVIAVGAVLADTLRQAGLSVIHDTSVNDYPSYNSSYWSTLQKIEQWKAKYPSIQMVIDVHRDAVYDTGGDPIALSATAADTACARLMLVVGTDQGGLEHPGWQENLANALKLQAVLEGKFPGLCRPIDLRTERFNQHAAPGSVIVEVGSHGNTLPQALASAKLLGEGIADMVQALQTNSGRLE